MSKQKKTKKDLIQDIRRIKKLLKEDCIILTVEDDTLFVDAGNKTPEEIKQIASVFFKEAYGLTK